MAKIVVVGSANTDMTIRSEKIPAPGETVVGGIRDTMEKDTGFRMYYSHVRVVSTRFRNDAGIIGAAALAIREQKEDAE